MGARRALRWVVGIPVVLAVLAAAGAWVYMNVIKDDPPDRLSLGGQPGEGGAAPAGGIEGTWRVANGSEAGYRAKEVLLGQSGEGVGRTSRVTGEFVVQGSRVTAGSFTVDMASVRSDEDRRDSQFRSRIMDTARYPNATFRLLEPIDLGGTPGEGQPVRAKAVGDLTLRGTTKRVTIDVEGRLSGGRVEVAGSYPVVWRDWGIPDPSFGFASVEDRGLLEFKLVFAR